MYEHFLSIYIFYYEFAYKLYRYHSKNFTILYLVIFAKNFKNTYEINKKKKILIILNDHINRQHD